ncbi:serine/arginine-rich splicing factor 4-like [Canna indica]|uniref:Serine/arginine-rich splicing factor 4-like n=1 Tax=Canna indica TaxID=4628 RepID=A0AAQ3QAG2_9LILI|nr:serine/arginine-rich splicing factor 4-like [Canna indica]
MTTPLPNGVANSKLNRIQMSLYVGNLSPNVRQEELEHVFRRFGRCNIQLKDGYGFAVYEATADAERALRALRGKPICGEQLSLNWSNRQPRPFQRPARATRFYKPFHRRGLREENDEVGIRGSIDSRGFYGGTSRPSPYNHEIRSLDDALDKKMDQISEKIIHVDGGKGANLGVTNEVSTTGLDHVEHDRWGDPVIDRYNSNGADGGDDFDRYEPYHGYDKRDDNENLQMDSPHNSVDRGSSKEKSRRRSSIEATGRKFEMKKPQQTCYKCGQLGHIMRTCPSSSGRESAGKFIRKREGVSYREKGRQLKPFRNNSWRSPDAIRDSVLPKRHKRDRKELYPAKARRSTIERERSPESRERHQSKLREDFLHKRRKKLGHGAMRKTLRRGRYRKSHTPSSSRSPRSSSLSRSESPRSGSSSSSHSRLRAMASRSRSLSSNSRSSSYTKSERSRSRSKSKSQSKSMLRSPTISVSTERKAECLPINEQIDQTKTSPEGTEKNVMNSKFNQLNSENVKDTCEMLEDGNPSTSYKVGYVNSGEHPGYTVDDERYSTPRFVHNEKILCSNLSKYDGATSEDHEENINDHEALPLKVNKQTSAQHVASHSTRLTTEEMFAALNHYGLGKPEEGQIGLTIEDYFGAARLWPWEIIYYRRLKKGPISNENYAKRLEQNREFGIVDKYIRSSSGWGENIQ